MISKRAHWAILPKFTSFTTAWRLEFDDVINWRMEVALDQILQFYNFTDALCVCVYCHSMRVDCSGIGTTALALAIGNAMELAETVNRSRCCIW